MGGSEVAKCDNKPRQVLELHYEDYRTWGETAAMLSHLAREVEESLS